MDAVEATDRIGDDLRGRRIVAGQHDDAQPLLAQRGDRVLRVRPDWVGDSDEPGERPIDRDEHDAGTVAAPFFRSVEERLRIDAYAVHLRGVADDDDAALDRGADPRADLHLEPFQLGEPKPALHGCGDDGVGERVFRSGLDRRDEPEQIVLGRTAQSLNPDQFRLALGEGPGLVDQQRIDALEPLQRLGAFHEHARLRAAPGADHDRHRRRQPQRARTGDDEHGDRVEECVTDVRFGADEAPDNESGDRDHDDERHEPARDAIGDGLDRCAAALRFGHHPDDAREHGVAADRLRLHDETAGAVHRAAGQHACRFLGDRERLAGEHRLVDRGLAIDDDAIDRHRFAGADTQAVARGHFGQRHLGLGAVGGDAARGLRGEIEQRADRLAGCRARAQFEHLAEQHERDDDACRFVIDRHHAVHVERRGEQPWRERRDQTVEERSADADRDQREHVEMTRLERRPAAHEERRARPQHDRRGERELQPRRACRADQMQPEQVGAHRQSQERNRQHRRHPEAPREIDQFGIGRIVERRRFGFERHAANGASARSFLTDLRVHRTRPDRARRRMDDRTRNVRQVAPRIGDELRPAASRTEMIIVPVVRGVMRRRRGIDGHAADGIECGGGA